MKTFRYVQINERPDGAEPLFDIGDLVQIRTYNDHFAYRWVSSGKAGMVAEILFFLQESYEANEMLNYVTEYRVVWLGEDDESRVTETMLIKLETK
jgi:hypothetical protein